MNPHNPADSHAPHPGLDKGQSTGLMAGSTHKASARNKHKHKKERHTLKANKPVATEVEEMAENEAENDLIGNETDDLSDVDEDFLQDYQLTQTSDIVLSLSNPQPTFPKPQSHKAKINPYREPAETIRLPLPSFIAGRAAKPASLQVKKFARPGERRKRAMLKAVPVSKKTAVGESLGAKAQAHKSASGSKQPRAAKSGAVDAISKLQWRRKYEKRGSK